MTTSGTANFNLDFAEIAEESFERCGMELRSGYELKTARRSLNLLLVEWANRGYNLWTLEEGALLLSKGQSTYDLPADTVDLADHVVRTGVSFNQSDISISRISNSTYSSIPNKASQGRPVQLVVLRLTDNPKVVVWPVPDNDTYTLVYWRLRRIQDTGPGGTKTIDVPFRFLNAMIAGLAYYLSMKIPVDTQKRMELKLDYEQQFQLASDEDREKSPVRFVPRVSY